MLCRDEMKISVIVTVLNEGPAICRLLDSLAAQTRQPHEVVIVDGGSTDDTLATLQAYADQGCLARAQRSHRGCLRRRHRQH
jgi:glycosyltransferase involved in cell wall biosynthesis